MFFISTAGEKEPKPTKEEEEKEKIRMRKCALCECLPRMYCESDQAYLCWECDEKVHGANFLVAKHSRSLLCHVCQSLTPWKASGPKLGPTVSVCDACVTSAHCEVHDTELVKRENNQSERTSGDDDLDEDDYDDDEEEDDDDDDEEYDDIEVDYDEEEDDENQVVPWSGDSQYPPPPPVVSSSCSSSCQEDQVSLKRGRGFGEFYSDVRLVQSLCFVSFRINRCSVSVDLAKCDLETKKNKCLFCVPIIINE